MIRIEPFAPEHTEEVCALILGIQRDEYGIAIARAVATTFHRLLAVKDEYEVARLHTDPAFRAALEAQFDGVAGRDFRVKFNLAPPLIARGKHGTAPRKMQFGQWL